MIDNTGLSAVPGFQFSGICSDGNNKKNIGLIYSPNANTFGTAVYTKSDVVAPPVIVSKDHDKTTFVKRAVLINSGNANAFTGEQGLLDSRKCAETASSLLNIKTGEVYVASTGVIGQKLDMENILAGIHTVSESLLSDKENADNFIEAIMTTDTRKKQASVSFTIDGKETHIAACAKGAGMIMPDMATMLSVVLTDAAITPALMKKALCETVDNSFNRITIDGDTSTNDSVFLLSNGLAENSLIKNENSENYILFKHHLQELLIYMAREIVRDGEGVTKFITVRIINTPTVQNAKDIAFSIGNSPLVKTTFYGNQLNWGRLLMAIGKAQTRLDCNIIDIFVNNYSIIRNGEPNLSDEEFSKAEISLKQNDIDILVDFKQGSESTTIWTCDYSIDYIKINANYIT